MSASTNPPSEKRLGDFEIVCEIGRGGMGVVYKARQISLNRNVALKVLSGGLGLTGKAVQRFRREAEAAAKLHHTNIVPIYATGEENGAHFYAMELIDGPSLDQLLVRLRREANGAVPSAPAATPAVASPTTSEQTVAADGAVVRPPPEGSNVSSTPGASSLSSGADYFDNVAHLVAEVADALQHAHDQGVIHRDIKPSNLLLSAGRLSINDFGLARVLEEPGMTLTGDFVGTPAYVSPEQITAGRTPLDHRTDIFSLGATLYEMLTLERPFKGDGREMLLSQILHKEPKAPRKINKKIPIDLETICLKALEKDPDRRYQTAQAMADDLRRYVSRFAIAAKRAGPLERVRKWVRRHPALTASTTVASIAVVAAVIFAWRAHLAEEARLADLAKHQEELQQEKRRNAMERAMVAAFTLDLEGAEEATAEAERLGASTAEVRLLRGYVALCRGQGAEAVRHLEQAVKLAPESIAARALLASSISDEHRYLTTIREMELLTPRTPEDYLFMGQALSWVDPEAALKTIDKAFHKKPSVLAYLIRADARTARAEDSGDLDLAAAAVDDGDTAKKLLPDNRLPLLTSVGSRMPLAHLLLEAGKMDEAKAVRAVARKDADRLARYSTIDVLRTRFIFYRSIGAEEVCEAELRRAAPGLKTEDALWSLGSYLYHRGAFPDLLKAMADRDEFQPSLLRCLALAETGKHEEALRLQQTMAERGLRGWDLFNNEFLLAALGRVEEAKTVSRVLLRDPKALFPGKLSQMRPTLDFFAGERSAEDALKDAKGSRWTLCNVQCAIGVTRLAEGDRAAARRHFQKALDTGCAWIFPYELSWIFLERMKDEAWPRWLKEKASGD